jgi:amidase
MAAQAAMTGAESSKVCLLSAVEQASLIRAKKISARELLAEHLRQIERVNPKVNAIVTLAADQAQQAALRADEKQARGEALGLLHGLPAAHKDLVDTKGIRTTHGSPLFRDFVPSEDALIVKRIKAAGAITIGKTNTPEFGAGSQTFNRVFGATRNPYDLSKTCGGSSGGAAVSLACGMVPVADGSDTGGSLRNPAAFCNVVGFRPTMGRVPDPIASMPYSKMSTSGPMGRTVADVLLLLRAIMGPDAASPGSLPETGDAFDRSLDRDLKGVRVAWFRDLGGIPFDKRIRAVVDRQVKTFESMGCIVEQAEPDFAGVAEAFPAIRVLGALMQHGERSDKNPGAYKDTIVWEIERARKMSAAEIGRAEVLRGQYWRRFQAFLAKYEFFILPTTQVPPFDVTIPYVTEIDGTKLDTYIDWMRSCWYISLAGNPAISMPCGFTDDDLPVGLQIVGRDRADFSVLQMARAFEKTNPAGQRRPSIL